MLRMDEPDGTAIRPEPCGGSGVCQRCGGSGVHADDECEVCFGTGECPCVYDGTCHPSPVVGERVCGAPLVVEHYGGGLRYHCPECDVQCSADTGHMPTASWTNGAPPDDRRCPRILAV